MTKKSRFMEKQPSAKVVEKDKVYVYICLNEKEVTENRVDESAEPVTMYEYDYNEIIEDIGILDINDVKANPEKYLNYGNEPKRTDTERINVLEATTDDIILMMADLIGGEN
jgi:hypothetical protein